MSHPYLYTKNLSVNLSVFSRTHQNLKKHLVDAHSKTSVRIYWLHCKSPEFLNLLQGDATATANRSVLQQFTVFVCLTKPISDK